MVKKMHVRGKWKFLEKEWVHMTCFKRRQAIEGFGVRRILSSEGKL